MSRARLNRIGRYLMLAAYLAGSMALIAGTGWASYVHGYLVGWQEACERMPFTSSRTREFQRPIGR